MEYSTEQYYDKVDFHSYGYDTVHTMLMSVALYHDMPLSR